MSDQPPADPDTPVDPDDLESGADPDSDLGLPDAPASPTGD